MKKILTITLMLILMRMTAYSEFPLSEKIWDVPEKTTYTTSELLDLVPGSQNVEQIWNITAKGLGSFEAEYDKQYWGRYFPPKLTINFKRSIFAYDGNAWTKTETIPQHEDWTVGPVFIEIIILLTFSFMITVGLRIQSNLKSPFGLALCILFCGAGAIFFVYPILDVSFVDTLDMGIGIIVSMILVGIFTWLFLRWTKKKKVNHKLN